MLKRFIPIVLFILTGLPLNAQSNEKMGALWDAMRMTDTIQIMQEEGLIYGTDLEEQMFTGQGGVKWAAVVKQIYSIDWMETTVRDGLNNQLKGADIDAMLAFLTSEQGQRIVDLEISARRALLDETVEEASKERLLELAQQNDPILHQLDTFAEVNDLVEANVVGALNSNYAFYRGLADSGVFPFELTEDQILQDVWGQEEEIRLDTEDWLYAYLALAYQPLDASDLDDYIAFSQTDSGRALNSALFAAFDVLFVEISRSLGAGAAAFMVGSDI